MGFSSVYRNDLKSARALFSIEDYKGANNRAYYSIFHAINAVHAVSGKAYKRHKDAVGYFNQMYVATGKFSRECGKRLGRLKRKREVSDYDDFYVASNEEAIEQYESAEMIVKQVQDFLLENDIDSRRH